MHAMLGMVLLILSRRIGYRAAFQFNTYYKFMIKHLLAVAGLLSLVVGAHAAPFVDYGDVDTFMTGITPGVRISAAAGQVHSVSGIFQFEAPDGTPSYTTVIGTGGNGYPAPAETVISNPMFNHLNQQVLPESVNLKLFLRDPARGTEAGTFVAAGETVITPGITNYFKSEQGVSGPTLGIETAINNAGQVSYTITATSGEFYIDAAYMFFSVNVPDNGSSVALLGLALVGVEGLRRKLGAGRVLA